MPNNHPDPELVLLTGHTAPVESVAFSPDGALLATAARDGLLILWDAQSGQILRRWECRASWVGFSPDGTLLAASGESLYLHPAGPGNWEEVAPGACGPVVFHPGTQKLVTMDGEAFLVVDWCNRRVERRVPLGLDVCLMPPPAAVSSDGSTAAFGGWDSRGHLLRIWDLATGELKRQRRVPRTLWATGRGADGKLRRTHGAQADIQHLALTPDGRLLAIGGMLTLWLCCTRTGRRKHLLQCGEGVHALAFSPDGAYLAVGTGKGTVRLWCVTSGQQKAAGQAHSAWVSAIAFSADGMQFAVGSHDSTITTWRLEDAVYQRTLAMGFPYQALAVAYSPDGSRIAVSYQDETIRLWSARTGELERVIPAPGLSRSLFFTEEGRVISTGIHPTDAAWDVETGEMLRPGPAHEEAPACGQWLCEGLSTDGRLLATSRGWEGIIEIRRRDTGELLQRFSDPDEEDMVEALVFSPDNRILAAGYMGFRVRLWDVATGRRLQLFRAHEDSTSYLAFSPDGSVLAIGGGYGPEVVLCRLASCTQPVRVVLTQADRENPEEAAEYLGVPVEELLLDDVSLLGHTNNIRGVCFSPDGARVATVAADAALKVWEASTGRLLASMLPLPSPGGWIVCTPDGYYHGSPGVDACIGWRIGEELHPGDLFAASHHAPSEVARRIGGSS